VDDLSERMRENHFTVAAMHGEMPQKEREMIMTEFRKGDARVLITTDVWARGIDVAQVTMLLLLVLKLLLVLVLLLVLTLFLALLRCRW